jgi:hypothetical protein
MIIKTCKPDLQWVEKWDSICEFRADFPSLAADPDSPRLLLFANILQNVLRYCSSVKNFQRILTICVCLAEGPDHTRLITGSSQCSYTEARVTTLNLVTQRHQYQRKAVSASKVKAKPKSTPKSRKKQGGAAAAPGALSGRSQQAGRGRAVSTDVPLGRTVPGATGGAGRGVINQSLRSSATPFNTRADQYAAYVDENTSPEGSRCMFNALLGCASTDSGAAASLTGRYGDDYCPLTPMQTCASVGGLHTNTNTGGSLNSISLFELDAGSLTLDSSLLSLGDTVYTAESLDGPSEVLPAAPGGPGHRRTGTGRSIPGSAMDRTPEFVQPPSSGYTPEQQSPLNFSHLPSSGERFTDYYRSSGREQQINNDHRSQAFGQSSALKHAANHHPYANRCADESAQDCYQGGRWSAPGSDGGPCTRSTSRRLRSLSTTLSSNTALTNTGGSVNYSSVFSGTHDFFDRDVHSSADNMLLSQYRQSSRGTSSSVPSLANSCTNDANWVDCGTPPIVRSEPNASVLDANVEFLRRRLQSSLPLASGDGLTGVAEAAASSAPLSVLADAHLQATLNKILPANIVDDILGFQPVIPRETRCSWNSSTTATAEPVSAEEPGGSGAAGEASVDGDRGMFVQLGVNDRGHDVYICVVPR